MHDMCCYICIFAILFRRLQDNMCANFRYDTIRYQFIVQ